MILDAGSEPETCFTGHRVQRPCYLSPLAAVYVQMVAMQTDDELLTDYAGRNSDEAFRALVNRYAGLVYHAALRQCGKAHAAEEVTQAVFIALAQKAGKLPRGVILSGWLFRATRFAVSNLAREDIRRQRREQEAVLMETTTQSDASESAWEHIAPHLNSALDALPARDREAVLVRFFGEKSHKDVARALGVSEDAAKMRVSRALEKLRQFFTKQGLVVPSAALFAALSAHAAQAAPAGLGASVATVAVAKGSAAGVSTLTLAKGILKLMAWSKTKTVLITGVVLLFAGATTTVVLQRVPSKTPPPIRTAGVDRAIPKATLRVMSQALETGDAPSFLACFNFTSPGEDQLKLTLERLVTALGKYRQAAIQRFGAAEAGASFPRLPFKLPAEKIESATVSIDGDTAQVQLDRRESPALFTRTNGEWKTTPAEFFHLPTDRFNAMGTRLSAALDQVMADVTSGKYATAVDAANAVQGKAR